MIVVTGVPGSGKTRIARALAKRLKLPLIEVNALVKQKKLYTGREGGSLVVDLKALKKALKGFKGVAEGHVLCEIALPAKCVVLRAPPKTIKSRLKKRGYSEQKIRDNVEAEALDYCAIRARQNYRSVVEVDTTGLSVPQCVARVLKVLRTGRSDFVDWSSWFT